MFFFFAAIQYHRLSNNLSNMWGLPDLVEEGIPHIQEVKAPIAFETK